MTVRKAFRFLLELTPEQTHVMARVAGCVRFVWNKGLTALITAICEALVIVARTRDLRREYGDLSDCRHPW
jgi:hypothetical protein